MGQVARSISPAQVKRKLAQCRDFSWFASEFWSIYDKQGNLVKFNPLPSQQLMLAKLAEQRKAGRPGRLRVLKYRQAGSSLLWRLYMLHQVLLWPGRTAISIADKLDLPSDWIRRCQAQLTQVGRVLPDPPHIKASSAHEIYLDEQQSRYHIGSALGDTPGMGETVQALHCSECAYWHDPDAILSLLLPGVPPGIDTTVIQESTGAGVGNWWYQRYNEARRGEPDPNMPPGTPTYDALFIPWFIQPEYTLSGASWAALGHLSDREGALRASCEEFCKGDGRFIDTQPITPGQVAWRRYMVREEFNGDEDRFANQYPANEIEAFLAGGEQVFTPNQVRNARDTVRTPCWRGNIFPGPDPKDYNLVCNASGDLLIWEQPDARFHYALGADCQWGTKDTADYDALYVECLETSCLCAQMRGRYDFPRWREYIESVGHHYNICPVAPERNSKAATLLMPLLIGNVDGRAYPNIWVRTDDISLRGHRPKDYGWYTDEHTKGQIIVFAKAATLSGTFDWADQRAVDEMEAYIRDPETGKLTAPEGNFDDCLMARMITGYVAHRCRLRTDLWHEPEPPKPVMTKPAERLAEMAGGMPEDNDTA